ncbi:MAG TPA: hypothetical protein VGE07_11025 [Herpetosiphonaceae bacterium]
MTNPPSPIHPDCRAFVAAVEALLARRQADPPRNPADGWGPRSWSRSEFEDMVYGSYKPMRQGRVTRPPRRELVMEIADYLCCGLEERNQLLLAAGGAPVDPYLTGAELERAVGMAVEVVGQLAMPAVVINRDWRIHHINDHALALFGVERAQLAAFSPDQLNVLHLLFDPAMPLYPHLIHNRDSWLRMARQTIYGFKRANLLSQGEPWYAALVGHFHGLPEFAHHWQTVDSAAPFAADPSSRDLPGAILLEARVSGPGRALSVWLRPLLVSVGYFQFDFPQIVGFVPADEEGKALFAALGWAAGG